MTIKKAILSAISLFFITLSSVEAAVITADTVWQKEISITEDTLVPRGITLTIRPGTVVKVSPAETTKTDPEFISPLTEITVRGRIVVEGAKDAPVRFISADPGRENEWAGIIVDGGEAAIRNSMISGAESALYIIDGTVAANSLSVSNNRYGITSAGKRANISLKDSSITGNDYGLIIISDIGPDLTGTSIIGNRKKDFWKEDTPHSPEHKKSRDSSTPLIPLSRTYTDEALVGDTIWRGRIRIDGNLRIPEGSRLLITPGTIVEFSAKDANGDGLGENGILIQGLLVAKGTKEKPIIFRSAELNRKIGDWDSVSLMNNSKAENLIENCIFEDAYRGLHFHYSTVKVIGSYFANNYRGIQFQESSVDISDSLFSGNKSAIQGRDSSVKFYANRLYDNHQGVNFFRNSLIFSGNRISGSMKEGARVREGSATISKNLITANRQGMMLADIYFGSITDNVIANSSEAGLALRNADNLEVTGNYLGRNGSNGLNLQDVRADIRGNLFAFNSERGVGITSFAGAITANNFDGNGLYAIDLESADDIEAANNWWGGDSDEKVLFDKRKDPARGIVKTGTTLTAPCPFRWPIDEFSGDITLAGDVLLNRPATIPVESALTVSPGTKIMFAAAAGLTVRGKINSPGTASKPVTFTSLAEKKPGAWDEIILEQALDSSFSHTIIEYGTWGIHGHFTNLMLDHVRIQHNIGGLRFRSGPVTVRQSVFSGNGIGIRSYIGNGIIEENIITGNEIGIFVRERGAGVLLKRNNIFDNSDYNIRSGDFNTEDIPAAGNWWGAKGPARTVYDGRVEEGVGKVLFDPALAKPVNLENAGVK